MKASLPLQALGPDICASPQLTPEAMSQVAEAGFQSVINNRPDFEGGAEQPTSSTLDQAAQAAGLSYAFVPVSPGRYTPEDLAQMSHLLATLPKPILLFCRSGARSSQLYQLATSSSPALPN